MCNRQAQLSSGARSATYFLLTFLKIPRKLLQSYNKIQCKMPVWHCCFLLLFWNRFNHQFIHTVCVIQYYRTQTPAHKYFHTHASLWRQSLPRLFADTKNNSHQHIQTNRQTEKLKTVPGVSFSVNSYVWVVYNYFVIAIM